MRSPRGKVSNCNSSDLEAAPKIMAHNGMHTAGHTSVNYSEIQIHLKSFVISAFELIKKEVKRRMKVTHKMGVFVCVLCLCLCLCLWVYLCLNVGDSKAECQLGGETELLCNQGAARTNRGRQSQRPIDVPTKGLT